MDQPNFKHDCARCEFQGSIYNGWDVYTCPHPKEEEVILRYGDEPDEYKAQPYHIAEILTGRDPDYDEAIGLILRNRGQIGE
jgi:hypothetical protein